MGGRGNTGGRAKNRIEPWSYVVSNYKEQIKGATELTINPDNGHAYFSANEAPVTPIIDKFMGNLVGSDVQIKRYFQEIYPDKRVNITRSKYI